MLKIEDKPERWGVFANITGDRVLRDGAKVQLVSINGGGENWEVRGLSRSGRRITKYVKIARLSNWRVGMIPPGYQDTPQHAACSYATKEDAEKDWASTFKVENADAKP